ncbi:MAG: hypothetical protein HY817_03415 [Candidatus Abawacabacteria bacterium]|nr:hypothetical protein [Candidatus Abawacabacteria bacterium]
MSALLRTCSITGKAFIVSDAEQAHMRKFEELHPLLKIGDIALPTIHPLEIMRQMQSYVTLNSLFNGISAISGKLLITRYSPILGYKVCTHDEFWGETVDNTAFGKSYDFSRSFFQQWNELLHGVYMQPLVQINCNNSPYVDASSHLQNCYMCFGVGESEDCFYCIKSRYPLKNRDCIDGVGIVGCELCYSCVDCDNCYACQHCHDCISSVQCFGSYDLIGCKHCFGCYGLRHQEFVIYNQQVAPEEYEAFIKQARLGDYSTRQIALQQCELFLANAKPIDQIRNCENVTGNYLRHCQNVEQCYLAEDLQDCGWSTGAKGKDCWRGEVLDGELGYNSVILFGRLGYGNSINVGNENFYSYMIFNCDSCFGCTMLKKKSYCILNKQYSKEDYYLLVPQIIAHMKAMGEWGQFLPPRYAPHFYSESQAAEWFDPLSEPELKRRGYRCDDIAAYRPSKENGRIVQTWSESIVDVDLESVLQQTFVCVSTGNAYRFDRREIEFYQAQKIPLPRIHWKERLKRLMSKRKLIPTV